MNGDIQAINHWAKDYKRQTLARATNGMPPSPLPSTVEQVAKEGRTGKAKKRKRKIRKSSSGY